jgi:hypothetical protein
MKGTFILDQVGRKTETSDIRTIHEAKEAGKVLYDVTEKIPVPETSGRWSLLASKMVAGSSVLVADNKEAKILKAAIHNFWCKKRGVKGVVTKAAKVDRRDGAYRVWRVT